MKSCLRAIQYFSKYIENLSTQTDVFKQLLKYKKTTGTGQRNTPKHLIYQEIKSRKHRVRHIIAPFDRTQTTDASTKGLGATLWQETENGYLKPIAFASRFFSESGKNTQLNEMQLLAVVWGV